MAEGAFDLAGYLARIGWEGPLGPNLATLRSLVARQAATIPFEGIEALLGRTPDLDTAALQAKLVGARRGGWCYEQNSLLALALGAVGFSAVPLLARVRQGTLPEVATPRTHMVFRVDLPEGPHLVDVGFGGSTPTGPLALRDGVVQATPHERMRLVAAPGGLLLQALLRAAWEDLYLVGPEPVLPVDIEATNWLVANRPGGLFTANLVAARAPAGKRLALLNRRLTIRDLQSDAVVERLDAPGALAAMLREGFGIALDAAETAGIDAALAEVRPGRIAITG